MAQSTLDGDDILVRHADAVRERAERELGLLERGLRARAETLVAGLQLLQHVEPRLHAGLRAEDGVQLVAN